MYITCEQCSTIFRLDENLLKPAGSNVRCSKCRYVFVAYPQQPDTVITAVPGAAAEVAEIIEPPQDTFDQELEGIDLAELDSILEQDQSLESIATASEFADDVQIDEPLELDEADLDLDFESALEGDFDDTPAESADAGSGLAEPVPEAIEEDIDLDMDFELDDSVQETASAPAPEPGEIGDDFDLDLDMDFELDADLDEMAKNIAREPEFTEEDIELNEDIELALDEFEDALEQVDDIVPEAALTDSPPEEMPKQDVDAKATAYATADDGDFDLGDLGSLLDADDDEPAGETVEEDTELSLSDDNGIELDEAPAAAIDDEGDDLDLTGGLADLLDDDDLEDEDKEPEDVELSLDEDLDLADDTDLLLEDETPESTTEPQDAELSLDDDLDLELSDEPELELDVEGTIPDTSAGQDEEEIVLDGLDALLDEEDVAVSEKTTEDQELSLSDDLELDLSEDSAAEAAEAVTPETTEVGRDEFDLSDFEDLLDAEDTAKADQLTTDESEEGFDLVELDNLLDESEADAESAVGDAEPSLDDDMELSLDDELSLDMEPEASAVAKESQTEEDDFDFSMLDSDVLEEEGEAAQKTTDDDLDLSLDDDMELTLDDGAADRAEAETVSDASIDDLEDLEFELDAEFEDKPIHKSPEGEKAVEAAQDEELDLTDIERMLENDTIVPDIEDASEGVELDLDSSGPEKWTDDLDGDLGLGSDDEIDLSEIEEAINAADIEEVSDDEFSDEEEDLELELDIDEPSEKKVEEPEPLELELELDEKESVPQAESGDADEMDFSDLDLSMEEQPGIQSETVDGGDIQLEFQVDTKDPDDFELEGTQTVEASATTTGFRGTTGFPIDDETFSGEETITTELVKEVPKAKKAAPKPKKKKRGAGKFLIFILFLAVLGGGGYFGYDYVVKNNIQIPYLSDYINPEAKDPVGILQLSTIDINGKFIENEVAGRLFVITGKVRNGYKVPRKLIRLKGNLYTKGKALAKTEQTFAGLVMADQELSSKSFTEIKKRLSTTTGQDAAITVAPGKTVPFMVVFSQLPPDLDEYIVEMVSSIKAQ